MPMMNQRSEENNYWSIQFNTCDQYVNSNQCSRRVESAKKIFTVVESAKNSNDVSQSYVRGYVAEPTSERANTYVGSETPKVGRKRKVGTYVPLFSSSRKLNRDPHDSTHSSTSSFEMHPQIPPCRLHTLLSREDPSTIYFY